MYAGVPIIAPVTVIDREDVTLAMPKSVTTGRPRVSIRMLEGFTSRWITPSACANRSASDTCAAIAATSGTSIAASSLRIASSVRPSMYFITMKSRPSRSFTEYTVTIPGWSRWADVRASITNRSWIPATATRSGNITLMATRRSSAVSRAR